LITEARVFFFPFVPGRRRRAFGEKGAEHLINCPGGWGQLARIGPGPGIHVPAPTPAGLGILYDHPDKAVLVTPSQVVSMKNDSCCSVLSSRWFSLGRADVLLTQLGPRQPGPGAKNRPPPPPRTPVLQRKGEPLRDHRQFASCPRRQRRGGRQKPATEGEQRASKKKGKGPIEESVSGPLIIKSDVENRAITVLHQYHVICAGKPERQGIHRPASPTARRLPHRTRFWATPRADRRPPSSGIDGRRRQPPTGDPGATGDNARRRPLGPRHRSPFAAAP